MLDSERIVLAAPMSYSGSATRLWRLSGSAVVRWTLLLWLVLATWILVAAWYAVFGLFLVPYRLVRRSQRRRRLEDARHRETMRYRP